MIGPDESDMDDDYVGDSPQLNHVFLLGLGWVEFNGGDDWIEVRNSEEN